MRAALIVVLASAVLATGCSPSADGGIGARDAGTDRDAGAHDAGPSDIDGGPSDIDGGFDGGSGPCTDGDRRCSDLHTALVCEGGAWTLTPCATGTACDEGLCAAGICTPGDRRCADTTTAEVCAADGTGWDAEPCHAGTACSASYAACLPVVCTPGSTGCYDTTTRGTCNASGTGYTEGAACASGTSCDAGACVGDPCDVAAAADTHLGCEFHPVLTSDHQLGANLRGRTAVVVSNPAVGTTAHATLYDPAGTIVGAASIAGGTFARLGLAWNALDAVDATGAVQTRLGSIAYRLASDRPVAAWLYAPLEAVLPSGCTSDASCSGAANDTCDASTGVCAMSDNAFTSDSTLLFPTAAEATAYVVPALPHEQLVQTDVVGSTIVTEMPSLVTIVATAPGSTYLTVILRGPTAAGDGLPAKEPGTTLSLALNQNDVVQLASRAYGTASERSETQGTLTSTFREYTASDLTGSVITASADVAVYVGADCHFVPFDSWGCDHMTEQLRPVDAWGRTYVAAQSEPAGSTAGDIWQIVAAVDATQIVFEPSSVHGPVMLNAGEFVRVTTPDDFVVQSPDLQHPILVTEYLQSQDATGASLGDPSSVVLPPVSAYVRDPAFHVPPGWSQSWITVTRPAGSAVALDGVAPAVAWAAIGASGYEAARIAVGPGMHAVTGPDGVGVVVHGYSPYSSYAHVAGESLAPLNAVTP